MTEVCCMIVLCFVGLFGDHVPHIPSHEFMQQFCSAAHNVSGTPNQATRLFRPRKKNLSRFTTQGSPLCFYLQDLSIQWILHASCHSKNIFLLRWLKALPRLMFEMCFKLLVHKFDLRRSVKRWEMWFKQKLPLSPPHQPTFLVFYMHSHNMRVGE